MASSKRAFYESCSIEELHTFVKNCAVRDSKDDIKFWTTRASKRLCIAKLEELDGIFRQSCDSMSTETCSSVRNPASKQINNEGEDVLYSELALPIELTAHVSRSGTEEASLTAGSTRIATRIDVGHTALRYDETLPRAVQQARRVTVTINLSCIESSSEPSAARFAGSAHLIYALASKLVHSKLETLIVDLSFRVRPRDAHDDEEGSGQMFPEADASTLLLPLVYLPSKVDLSMFGTTQSTDVFIAEGRKMDWAGDNDLINFARIKAKTLEINDLVKRTGKAPGGLRCLTQTLHSIENCAGSGVSRPPNLELYASKMAPLWAILDSPLVRKLLEPLSETEASEGKVLGFQNDHTTDGRSRQMDKCGSRQDEGL